MKAIAATTWQVKLAAVATAAASKLALAGATATAANQTAADVAVVLPAAVASASELAFPKRKSSNRELQKMMKVRPSVNPVAAPSNGARRGNGRPARVSSRGRESGRSGPTGVRVGTGPARGRGAGRGSTGRAETKLLHPKLFGKPVPWTHRGGEAVVRPSLPKATAMPMDGHHVRRGLSVVGASAVPWTNTMAPSPNHGSNMLAQQSALIGARGGVVREANTEKKLKKRRKTPTTTTTKTSMGDITVVDDDDDDDDDAPIDLSSRRASAVTKHTSPFAAAPRRSSGAGAAAPLASMKRAASAKNRHREGRLGYKRPRTDNNHS